MLLSFASATLYELNASDKDVVFVVGNPFVGATMLGSALLMIGFWGTMFLTRSAHDLGASFAVETVVGVVCSVSLATSSAEPWAAVSTAFAR